MACLLKSQDVVCFWNGRHFKIKCVTILHLFIITIDRPHLSFPTHIFPSEIQTYRPPMANNNASIAKVVCHEGSGTFAALSLNGEMFTFSLNAPPVLTDGSIHDKHLIKPQRIWALRKQFSAVKVNSIPVYLSLLFTYIPCAGRRPRCRWGYRTLHRVWSCLCPQPQPQSRTVVQCEDIQIPARPILATRRSRLREHNGCLWSFTCRLQADPDCRCW